MIDNGRVGLPDTKVRCWIINLTLKKIGTCYHAQISSTMWVAHQTEYLARKVGERLSPNSGFTYFVKSNGLLSAQCSNRVSPLVDASIKATATWEKMVGKSF